MEVSRCKQRDTSKNHRIKVVEFLPSEELYQTFPAAFYPINITDIHTGVTANLTISCYRFYTRCSIPFDVYFL